MNFAPLDALHRPGPSAQSTVRGVDRLASEAGPFSLRARTTEPLGSTHTLEMLLDLAEVDELLTFFDTVKGRWKSFWCPSFQDDLELVADVAADDTTVTIRSIGYAAALADLVLRRHIAFCFPGNSFYHRRIESAVDNGGGTETLTLSAALDVPYTRSNGGTVSFLWHGRLESDAMEVQ